MADMETTTGGEMSSMRTTGGGSEDACAVGDGDGC